MYSIFKEYMDYNPETGKFIWKKKASQRVKVGEEVGSSPNNGYLRTAVKGVGVYQHKLAYWWVHGEIPEIIDHINRDRTDNRIANLRAGDRTMNNRNLGLSKHNKSGFHGVSGDGDKWYAHIYFNGSKKHLGTFSNKGEAVMARLQAEMVRDGKMSAEDYFDEYGKYLY